MLTLIFKIKTDSKAVIQSNISIVYELPERETDPIPTRKIIP